MYFCKQVFTYINNIAMKKYLILILFMPVLLQAQEVESINTLFDSLKVNPQTLSDEIVMEQALAAKQLANGKLFPEISAFGKYDYSSAASGMLPVTPNDLFPLIQEQSIPQPFSYNIYRVGASISMPVFAMSIYSTAAKAKMMYNSAADKKYINLLKNEALIVSSNANLQYLGALAASLEKKRESLMKTRELIALKVKNQRAPGSALLIIDNGINEIDLTKNNIALQREQLLASITSLTGITLKQPVSMTQTGTYQDGSLKSLDPLRKKIEADKLGLRAEKNKLVPSLFLNGNYNYSMANAYNNDMRVNENFTTVGVGLHIPIFTKSQYAQIKKSKLDVAASENELSKMTRELNAQAQQLQNSLNLIENSVALYEKSVQDKEKLLSIAKVSYNNNQMTIEDYLNYEDEVVLEKAKLFKARAEHWQTLMQLAVIYGNNIENIVK